MELPKTQKKIETVEPVSIQVGSVPNIEQAFESSPVFPQTDVVPTGTPRVWWQRIQRYVNGATRRLYIYDEVNESWHYTTLT